MEFRIDNRQLKDGAMQENLETLFKLEQKFMKDLYLKKLVDKTLSERSVPIKCLCLPQ